MPTRFRPIIALGFVLVTLVACAISPTPIPTRTPRPTPTPMPTPAPGILGKWGLVRVVVNEEVRPPFHGGEWIEFQSTSQLEGFDGCNDIGAYFTATGSGSFRVVESEVSVHRVDVQKGDNRQFCQDGRVIEGDLRRRFYAPLFSAMAYELRDDELWLYYPEDKSNVLVFRRTSEGD